METDRRISCKQLLTSSTYLCDLPEGELLWCPELNEVTTPAGARFLADKLVDKSLFLIVNRSEFVSHQLNNTVGDVPFTKAVLQPVIMTSRDSKDNQN